MNEYEEDVRLSAEGGARRAQILEFAQSAAKTRRRYRRVRVGAGAMIGVMIALAVMVPRQLGWQREEQISFIPPMGVEWPRDVRQAVVVRFIETDQTLVERLRISSEAGGWVVLSDEALLDQLAQAGRPAGLAWIHDRAMVVYRGGRRER